MNKIIPLIIGLSTISFAEEYKIKVFLDNNIKFEDKIETTENWIFTTPTYTEWVNSGSVYGCSNWSPDPSTVDYGVSFTQTATDCSQDQNRLRQDREQETTTNEIRNNGPQVTENRTIDESSTRTATGTKETWVAITPTYTEWVNSGSVYGCSNWSPDPSTVNSGVSFPQTATDCSQNQTRLRQDREQETTTNEIRNNGSQVTENRTIAESSTRTATGTKAVTTCQYASGSYITDNDTDYFTGFWSGTRIFTDIAYTTAVNGYNYSGYKYTLGTQEGYAVYSAGQDYRICRTPL